LSVIIARASPVSGTDPARDHDPDLPPGSDRSPPGQSDPAPFETITWDQYATRRAASTPLAGPGNRPIVRIDASHLPLAG